MHLNLPWNGFVEDDFYLFAEKAIKLYLGKEYWKKAQENGIEIINQIYDKEKIGEHFINRLEILQVEIVSHRNQNFLGNLLQHQSLQSKKYMSKWIEEKNKR